jgi:putative transposase
MKGKRYTTEDKIRILREVDGGKNVADVCQERNIAEQTFYRWKRAFGMMGISEARRLKELERENRELKQMLADSLLKNRVLEAVCEKNCKPGPSAGRCRPSGGGGDVFRASGVSVSGFGAFDVPVSGAAADPCGRTVKAAAAVAVGGTSAVWVSADCGDVTAGGLACGQTAHSTTAANGRIAGTADEAEGGSAWCFHGFTHQGDASKSCVDLGLYCGCDGAGRGVKAVDDLG